MRLRTIIYKKVAQKNHRSVFSGRIYYFFYCQKSEIKKAWWVSRAGQLRWLHACAMLGASGSPQAQRIHVIRRASSERGCRRVRMWSVSVIRLSCTARPRGTTRFDSRWRALIFEVDFTRVPQLNFVFAITPFLVNKIVDDKRTSRTGKLVKIRVFDECEWTCQRGAAIDPSCSCTSRPRL